MPQPLVHLCATGLSWAGRGLLLGGVLAGLLVIALRYWILPDIDHYRSDIAAALTRVAGQTIRIDAIQANWDGLRPHLLMQGISVADHQGHPVLTFPAIEGTVSWRSMLRGQLNFHEIVIDQPALLARRDAEGNVHIAGIALGEHQQDSGFFDWLLHQRRLIVRDAALYWQDDWRQSPVRYFESVNLHLQNKRGGRRHLFGLQAHSSDPLFSRVDLRGDLTGKSVQDLSAWQGQLYVALQDTALASWPKWTTLPEGFAFRKGKGSLLAWAELHGGSFTRWVSDINLRDAAIQASPGLPELEISRLSGRGEWRKSEEARGTDQQWFIRDLHVGLKGLPLAGPVDGSWRVQHGKDDGLPKHNLQATGLNMEVLTQLAASLPVEEKWHALLSGLSPRGTVRHVNLEWQGDWAAQPSFRINAAFNDLAAQSFGDYPAFKGMSGIVDASAAGGSLFFSAKQMEITRPQQPEDTFHVDVLTGRVDWKTAADRKVTRVEFSDVVFRSESGSGNLQGSYVLNPDRPGQIDLTGNLSRADISHLGRYVTWLAGDDRKKNLDKWVFSGSLADARFHVKAALPDFSGNAGAEQFSIRAETAISNVGIKIADDWPEITGATGHISIREGALDLSLSAARVAGIRLQKLVLQSDALDADRPEIRIKGEAEGESKEIAALLRQVDLGQSVGELLQQAEFSGNGQLQADMTLVIGQDEFAVAKLQGRYQFMDNRINLDRYVPDFYQVNGSLVFTGSGVSLEGMNARLLGGPVDIFSSPLPGGGIRIAATGHADFDRFRADTSVAGSGNLSQLWTQFTRGNGEWQVAVDVERNKVGIVIDTSLEGVELAFPAPFTKAAAEKIPMHLEKVFILPRDDHIRFRYGDIVTAEFERIRKKAHDYQPVRGVVHLGGSGALPQSKTTWIGGSVPELEWDQWRELFQRHAKLDVSIDHAARGMDNILTQSMQFDLHIGQFEFLSSCFNDVQLAINRQGEDWLMDVSSREIDGKIDWYAAAPQKVVARLKRLKIPEDAPETIFTPSKQEPPGDWPAVDIEADELYVKGGQMGQMKLSAVQRPDGWLVENLDIRHPDSRLTASGLWENHKPPYRIYSRIQLQSSNIGKLFKRHGYPGRVARGEGVLEGELDWAGKPSSIDYQTLSGTLQLEAQHGQFTELKPGIGRLLGVFDLRSLPRRLMLDFYDVFGKGFAFDELNGQIHIRNGIASVDNLHISGSAAELALNGNWDLVNETQALNLKVFPSFGLATPIAGIAAMIAKGNLRDPFDRVLLNEYVITGSWNDPVVIGVEETEDGVEQPRVSPQQPPLPVGE
ncbi:TIGR02099 family protein [Betaproteobacteria bacterium PRO4]|nr:TIGR02099 family protein [Betaproteobacteria bacterium PRO4]